MAYDEPFADPSALPTYAVAEAAGRHLKVVLNGEGADELFAGYRRHLAVLYFSRWERAFRLPAGALRPMMGFLPAPTGFRTPYAFFYRFVRGLGESPMGRYIVWSSDGFTEVEKRALYRPEDGVFPATADALSRDLSWLGGRGVVGDFMAVDFALSMGDCLLVKMDIATMAHGLEARCPFLDHRLAEWAAGLPRRVLFAGRTNKPLLRALARRYLPDAVASAPKRGFEIPLIQWVRRDLFAMISDLCLSPNGIVREIFEKRQIEGLLLRRDGLDEERWAKRLWILLMLALWDRLCRRYTAPAGMAAQPPATAEATRGS